VTGVSRIGRQLEQSPALWSAALSLIMVAVVMAITTWLSGHLRISQWRIPDAEIRWITPGPLQLPRHSREGELPNKLGELPLGDPAPVQVFYSFKQRHGSDVPMAILVPKLDGQTNAFANFAPLSAHGLGSVRGLARPSAQSQVWRIPGDHLYRGQNRIDLVVTGTATRSVIGPLYFGPKDDLEAVARWGIRSNSIAQQVVLVFCALAIVTGIAAAAVGTKGRHLAAAAAFASAAARIILAQAWASTPPLWPAIDAVLVAMIAIAAGIAMRDGGDTVQWKQRLAIVLVLAAGLSGGGALVAASNGADRAAAMLGVISVLIGLGWLAWAVVDAARQVHLQCIGKQALDGVVTGLSLAGAIIAVCTIVGASLPGSPFAADTGFAFVLSVLALMATWRGAKDVVQGTQTRLDHTRTIQRQKIALETAARELTEQTRQSAMLEERQRMARDVHDGIGGQLASLIAQVRMRKINMDDVEQSLVGGLSELRLLVASLDVIGETLADAMATFQERARQQAAAAGMTLDWNQSDDLAAEIRDQRWLLNLYRLMQEAITNAIRHSGGDRITVTIGHIEGRTILVCIEDNGKGFEREAVKLGRGLANLEHRSKDLQGVISITQAQTGRGTVIHLQAPLPQ
jgi:signal transduction histidine kinase